MIGKLKFFSSKKTTSEHIYGVKRLLTTSDTAWERIEDAVDLVANATHDGTEVTNNFDSLYPWSDIISYNYDADSAEITAYYGDDDFAFDGSNGEVMTRIPEFWWKRIQEDGYEYIYIADYKAEGFTYSETFSLSRYTASGSSSRLYSKSGATTLVSTTQANFRTYASKIGMRLLDIWAWSKLQMLYLVEYADYDCQTMLGNGNSSSNKMLDKSGGCDTLGMKSGCLIDDGSHSVIYRGIEDVFGNVYQVCDGVSVRYSTCKSYVCEDSDSYSSASISSPYVALSFACPTSNGYIKTIGYDSNYPSIQMPSATGGSSSTYISDYYWYNNQSLTNTCVTVGGYYIPTYAPYCGLWLWYCNNKSASAGSTNGCRLLLDQ